MHHTRVVGTIMVAAVVTSTKAQAAMVNKQGHFLRCKVRAGRYSYLIGEVGIAMLLGYFNVMLLQQGLDFSKASHINTTSHDIGAQSICTWPWCIP